MVCVFRFLLKNNHIWFFTDVKKIHRKVQGYQVRTIWNKHTDDKSSSTQPYCWTLLQSIWRHPNIRPELLARRSSPAIDKSTQPLLIYALTRWSCPAASPGQAPCPGDQTSSWHKPATRPHSGLPPHCRAQALHRCCSRHCYTWTIVFRPELYLDNSIQARVIPGQ